MTDFCNLYRTRSVADTVTYGVGTCIEQTMLEKAFFDRMGISNQVFTLRQETSDDLSYNPKMHCFLLFYEQGKVYHFEHSNPEEAGIHIYDKEQDALDQIIRYYQEQDHGEGRRLDRFDEIPLGLTFAELNHYFDIISKTTTYQISPTKEIE